MPTVVSQRPQSKMQTPLSPDPRGSSCLTLAESLMVSICFGLFYFLFPSPGWIPWPLQWKRGALTTGPTWKLCR